MVTVRFLQDYASYKKGQEYKVSSAKTLGKLSEKGIIEVVKATPEAAVIPKAETATAKTQTAKKPKK